MSVEQVQVMIKVVSPEGKSEQVVGTIRPLLGSIRSRAGCLDCRILQDVENQDEITLLMAWRNETSFNGHVVSRDYRHILEWMEMSCRKPEITISREPDRNGMEFIEGLIIGQK